MEELDPEEFLDWIAYYKLEPWGEERADWRAMILASESANIAPTVVRAFSKHGGKSRPYEPKDFARMFKFDEDPREAERESGANTLTTYFRAMESLQKRRGRNGDDDRENVGGPRAQQ